MNAAALALVDAEPTAGDVLAELHELETSLVRLLSTLTGAVA